jgi:hypothetical protein
MDSMAWRRVLATALATALVAAAPRAAADPPGGARGTRITWRILANRGPDSATFASRFDVVARDADGTVRRIGPFDLPCYLSNDDGVFTCVYGGAFDYLRVRRVGGSCIIERQPSTEHGMGRTFHLGTLRCTPPIVERPSAGGPTD